MKIHDDNTSFQCDECEKSFNSQAYLRRHNLVHSDNRCFKCNICGKNFKCRTTLRGHIMQHNEMQENNPFTCDTRRQRCKDNNDLKRHMLVHSDDRPQKCQFCNKSFKQRASLLKHIKKTHLRKTFKCDLCEKTFSSSLKLEKHKIRYKNGCDKRPKSHSKIKKDSLQCTRCDKRFKTKYFLIKHEKLIHREKNTQYDTGNGLVLDLEENFDPII